MDSQLPRITVSLPPGQVGDSFVLPADRLHYLQRVLRLGTGAEFVVMNGKGDRWRAQLQGNRGILLARLENTRELLRQIHLGVAMPKGTGMETIIKQTTEVGVVSITPLISQRTLLHPSDHKRERWQKIAQEAAELACRSFVPLVHAPVALDSFLAHNLPHKFIGVTTAAPPLASLLADLPEVGDIVLLTGPEGGWTEAEVKRAQDWGWQPMSLGAAVLSAVTAPVVAAAVVSAFIFSKSSYQSHCP
ncbi:MAG: RsmE family RNA methyltransferase [Pseudanabaenaceae cyanobacterium SKYGB_i_bin29]|nr:16S rRNA (uracil(1498)-N(3))-methyltransferase [Pseudanabaenaceae cyanobacterium SKYG29]MDW8420274.1 RsmE family RNA methyltransferase [Pseudanabaenaceae cyanobacterium SKYGB_i_bin29]